MGTVETKLQLTEEDLEMIHTRSSMPKEEIMLWYEHFLKECPTGKMDKLQFVGYYRKFRKDNNSDEIVDRVFAAFDVNKDGTIEFHEVISQLF